MRSIPGLEHQPEVHRASAQCFYTGKSSSQLTLSAPSFWAHVVRHTQSVCLALNHGCKIIKVASQQVLSAPCLPHVSCSCSCCHCFLALAHALIDLGVVVQLQVEMLQYLSTVAKGPSQQVEVLVHVVSALFDINPSMSTHMAVPLWKRCTGTLLQVAPGGA